MAASFPSSIKSFGSDAVNGDYIEASHVNDLRAEVVAVETAVIMRRVNSTTSASSISPDAAAYDTYALTALAAPLTVNAPTNAFDGAKLIIRLKDNGTARALTWNSVFRAVGVTLPTTTVISKVLYVGFIYNATETKWDCIAQAQEA